MSKLPRAEKTERAVIGTLLQFPNKLADCEKLGISEIHFHGAEEPSGKRRSARKTMADDSITPASQTT